MKKASYLWDGTGARAEERGLMMQPPHFVRVKLLHTPLFNQVRFQYEKSAAFIARLMDPVIEMYTKVCVMSCAWMGGTFESQE